MKKNFTLKWKGNLLLVFLAAILLISNVSMAQPHWILPYCSSLPAATQSNLYGPMYTVVTANATSRSASIYPASQLAPVAGKTLTHIWFHRGNGTALAGTPAYKLYLKPVSATDWGAAAITWATEITGATLVYDGNPAALIGTTNGWIDIPFNITNFNYPVGQNLALFMEYTNPTATPTAITWSYDYTTPCVNTPANSSTTKYTNVTTGVLPPTLSTENFRRPYIAFDTLQPPCNTVPLVAGTATATNAICSGNPVNLSVSGFTGAQGISLQWQSYNGSTWVPIAGATTPNYTIPSVTATTQYRVAVTCATTTTINSNTTAATLVPTFVSTGTYTLNSALPTAGTNFQSIAALDSALLCGLTGALTINVNAAGTYSGQLHLKNMGSLAAPIIINGNGATITYSGAGDLDRACIKLDNADYVTINNLNITANINSLNAVGIQLINDADNVTISGCNITGEMAATGTTFAGIMVSGAHNGPTTAASGSDNLVITNNTIAGGYYGITLMGTTTTGILQNNQVTNNTIRDFYAYGIYTSYSNGMIISGNDIHRANRIALTTFGGVYAPTGHTKLMIRNNKIHDWFTQQPTITSTGYGIYLTASTPTAGNENIFSNNTFYNITGNGTHYGIYNSASSYTKYYYNTIVSDQLASTAGTFYALYHTGATPNTEFRNNIVYITRGGTGNKVGVFLNTATTSVVAANHNDYYINSAVAGTSHIGAVTAVVQTTLAAWQGAAGGGGDANSITVDPVFVNPLLGNLIPTVATGLNNLGSPIAGITTDITGATRNATTPDMGAYEWTPPVCLQPLGLNVTALTSTGATLGWTAVGGATGYEWMVTTSATPPATGNPIGTVTTVPSGTLTPATPYYMHLRTNCGANGYSYWSSIPFTTKPVNDDCANSINISNSLPTNGTTVGGTQTMAPCATTNTTLLANDVWYHFTTTSPGIVTVTATNTVGDVALEVFSGTCGSGTSLGCVDGPAIGTELITLPALPAGTYYVRVYGYLSSQTGFTVQVLHNGNPLSTNGINISATNKGSYNLVSWNVTSDIKYSSFELERSGDGDRFTPLATITANSGNEYTYNDNKPLSGMNYYRIKTTDLSGKDAYSKVVFTSVKNSDLFTAEAYPNPVRDKFTVKVFGNQGSNALVTVTDIAGKLIREVTVTGNETVIDMNGMEQGIYFVKYQDNVHTEVMKITKQ